MQNDALYYVDLSSSRIETICVLIIVINIVSCIFFKCYVNTIS